MEQGRVVSREPRLPYRVLRSGFAWLLRARDNQLKVTSPLKGTASYLPLENQQMGTGPRAVVAQSADG